MAKTVQREIPPLGRTVTIDEAVPDGVYRVTGSRNGVLADVFSWAIGSGYYKATNVAVSMNIDTYYKAVAKVEESLTTRLIANFDAKWFQAGRYYVSIVDTIPDGLFTITTASAPEYFTYEYSKIHSGLSIARTSNFAMNIAMNIDTFNKLVLDTKKVK